VIRKIPNNKAWILVLPVLILVAFSAIIPLMTVVNYSVQDIFDPQTRIWVGTEWFEEILADERLHGAFGRQLLFSALVLLIEVPLGLAIALCMPTRGRWVSVCLILLALPLLVPFNVVGTIWQLFSRVDIGLGGQFIAALGIDYNYTSSSFDAWITVLVMDIWHWTSLLVLLCYAGLLSIPEDYYQAARIDGASPWAIFRYIQLPRLANVLVIGVLLRFMDSFMIYAEPFVLTGGGPGNATTFLSQYLTTMAVGQFDLGPAAAFSLIYFLVILLFCWLFYTAVNHFSR
jgi:glycerol transport system permease protein